jgi:Fe-S-cluster-containing dehydrogenase component
LVNKILVIDADKCSGCKICELVCSYLQSKKYSPKKSFIRVMERKDMGVFIPVIHAQAKCNGCTKCVEWCPTRALAFMEPDEAALVRKRSRIGRFPAPLVYHSFT